jgi:hypothetical protein
MWLRLREQIQDGERAGLIGIEGDSVATDVARVHRGLLDWRPPEGRNSTGRWPHTKESPVQAARGPAEIRSSTGLPAGRLRRPGVSRDVRPPRMTPPDVPAPFSQVHPRATVLVSRMALPWTLESVT